MKYVYLIQSIAFPDQRYVGLTSDLDARIRAHNAGRSKHTSKFAPWKFVAFLGFRDVQRAVEFERYLKTGLGHAFANRHLW
jgi:predicted GIY-YIG superfamily endonuclease